MALFDTYGIKIQHDKPWCNSGEMSLFKRLRAGQAITVFRTQTCEVCGVEIPKPKRFCSKRCFDIKSPKEEDNAQEKHR